MPAEKPSVLIIYTGGTIGMVTNPETGSLAPLDFSHISREVPELNKFGFQLDAISFDPPLDSSDINPEAWIRLANILNENYHLYDGFVVLHGTDTMSYSASALSFMLENQYKPVIFTGSQLPIGTLRTDGKENLITAIEIAAAKHNGYSIVPEVCIYFENKLFRGNRTRKHNADHFNAFTSDNYPALAHAGIHLRYNYGAIHNPDKHLKLKIYTRLETNVAVLKVFPGITRQVTDAILNISGLKAIVLETFGTGNAPTSDWFVELIKKAIANGLIIVNVTQCDAGMVDMGRYDTSIALRDAGVVSGYDSTTEAMLTKLMFLLGNKSRKEEIIACLNRSISGEISVF
ncbi:MAG: asparaginase [Bacteroidia bacterium]|nr:asparaginase [Bacteroidia bacterium]